MTYLPGQIDVPCAQCGANIHRRGKRGIGHKKFCDEACERAFTLKGPRPPQIICTRCGVREKAVRVDGTRRAWCKPCEAEQKRRKKATS